MGSFSFQQVPVFVGSRQEELGLWDHAFHRGDEGTRTSRAPVSQQLPGRATRASGCEAELWTATVSGSCGPVSQI